MRPAQGFSPECTFPAGTTRVEAVARIAARHRIHVPVGLEVTSGPTRTPAGVSVFKGRYMGSAGSYTDMWDVTGEPQITPYPCEATAAVEILGDQE